MTTPPNAVRIVVDGSRCDGHGICALVLPERISLDRWGYASLDNEPIADPKTLARARRAVHACPALALALVGPVGTAVRVRRRIGRRSRSDSRPASAEAVS